MARPGLPAADDLRGHILLRRIARQRPLVRDRGALRDERERHRPAAKRLQDHAWQVGSQRRPDRRAPFGRRGHTPCPVQRYDDRQRHRPAAHLHAGGTAPAAAGRRHRERDGALGTGHDRHDHRLGHDLRNGLQREHAVARGDGADRRRRDVHIAKLLRLEVPSDDDGVRRHRRDRHVPGRFRRAPHGAAPRRLRARRDHLVGRWLCTRPEAGDLHAHRRARAEPVAARPHPHGGDHRDSSRAAGERGRAAQCHRDQPDPAGGNGPSRNRADVHHVGPRRRWRVRRRNRADRKPAPRRGRDITGRPCPSGIRRRRPGAGARKHHRRRTAASPAATTTARGRRAAAAPAARGRPAAAPARAARARAPRRGAAQRQDLRACSIAARRSAWLARWRARSWRSCA